MQSENLLLNKLSIIDSIQTINPETSSEKLNSHSTLVSDYTQIILEFLGFPQLLTYNLWFTNGMLNNIRYLQLLFF